MATPDAAGANVLELKNLSKTFVTPDGKTFEAIRDVNLIVRDEPGAGWLAVPVTTLAITSTTAWLLLNNDPASGDR